jgi:hypothetical protein
MKSNKPLLFMVLLASSVLFSCSGLPKNASGGGCKSNCGGGGNSLLNITVTSTPSTKFSVLWMAMPLDGVAVTPANGKVIGIVADPLLPASELVRLQTESNYIGKANISPGQYTSMTVSFNTVTGFFFNSSASTVGGCPLNSGPCAPATVSCPPSQLCQLPEVAPATMVVPISFQAAGSQNLGLDININLDIAMTTKNGLTIDFTQPNAITGSLLPRVGQPAGGSIDTLEDFTGAATSVSGNSVTVTPGTPLVQEPRTFTIPSTATFSDPFGVCKTLGVACLATNQLISVDGLLGSDGVTFTANEVDFLDPPSTHEIEGIVLTTGVANQFQLLVTNILGGQLNINNFITNGEIVTVNLQNGATFGIDSRNLVVNSPSGFAAQTDLFDGQVVMVRALQQIGNNPNITINSDRVVLRFSRLHGSVATVSGNNFSFTNTSIPSFFGTFLTNPQVQTFAGVTSFDGITGITGLNGNPPNVSVRALYLNPTTTNPAFLAAKVRKH